MTRLHSFLIALVLSAIASGCGGAEVTHRFEVSGYVRNPLTGEGVGGATVTFRSDTLYTKSTTTSGNGAYAMVIESDVPIGQVRAEKASYQPAEQTVYFDSDQRRIDLDLRPEP